MAETFNQDAERAPSHIIDLDRYPIDDLSRPETRDLVANCRRELDAAGCCVVHNFVLPQSLARMKAEADRLLPRTFWSTEDHNPYFCAGAPELPADHPQRTFQKRDSGFINSDLLEADSDLRAIYNWDGLTRFVSDCLGVSPIYCWADPLGCNPYGVMRNGSFFPWHFDGNEFTISILVQEAEMGGVFEYAPDIRSPENENFDCVKRVLDGGRDCVHALDLRPGDLQIFKGRFSMHRVTPVTGGKPRIIALPTYVVDPFAVNRPEHSKQVYGRALPIHYERESCRPDALTD